MEASSTSASADVDLYVLEYVANMRWLLRYATNELDPTVEQQYPDFVAQVVKLDVILSRTTFERSCRLGDLPFGIVRLSREAMLYLLVSNHLLGGCPPTMHPFLQQAFGAEARGAARRSPRQAPLSADLNVSFQSDAEDFGKESGSSGLSAELDAQPLAAIDFSTEEMSLQAGVAVRGGETQAMLLLLRWLFKEGVLSEDEVLKTVDLSRATDGCSNPHTSASTSVEREYERFCRHQQLAHHLAEMLPFYLGAHLLVSRSLLLQYCATLLTTEAVMQHVAHLRSVVPSAASRLSAVPPPSSVEGALLEWFQAIVDSINASEDGAAVMTRLRDCSALRAFVQCGPFCEDVMDPSHRDFFRLVQSGESVCVALLFYYPDAIPLSWLSTALRTVEKSVLESLDADSGRERLHRDLSLCYWTAIVAAMRQVGVWSLLTPEEVVTYGRTALPLHLFCLIQQIFAVLATNAEEDVRVSADTAWWEQMRSRDGLTEVMRAAAGDASTDTQEWSDTAVTAVAVRSGTALSGAQRVLRKSMQDTFLPAVLTTREVGDHNTGTERARMEDSRGGRLQEKCTVALPFSAARATASLETDELCSIQTGVHGAVGGEGGADEVTTLFSINEAHTKCEGQISARAAREENLETVMPILRPMLRRKRSPLALPCAADSSTATSTAPPDKLANVCAAKHHDALRRPDSPSAVFGAHAIETYTRAEEKSVCDGCATTTDGVAVKTALDLSEAYPTSADTLLHTREVDSGLRRCSTAAYVELAIMETLPVDMPVVKASRTAKMFSNERDQTELPSYSVEGHFADNQDAFVMVHPKGVSRSTLPTSACTGERSTTSSLTHSTDFLQRMLSPTSQDAHEAAIEISRSGDLSGTLHSSPAMTDSHHAADTSCSSPLLTPVTGTAVPTVGRKNSRTFPMPESSISSNPATPGEQNLVSRKRDTEGGDASPDAATAAPNWSSDALSSHLSDSRVPSSTAKCKTAAAVKRSAVSAASAAGKLTSARGSAVTPPTTATNSLPRENRSSEPHSRKSPCIEGTGVEGDVHSLLRKKKAEPLLHPTSSERGPSPPAEKSEQGQLPSHDPYKRILVEDLRKVASDSLPSLSHRRSPARKEDDRMRCMTDEEKGELRMFPPSGEISSLVFPGSDARRAPRHIGGGMGDDNIPSRTLSEATKSRELSPLTRVPAQSLSDTYGTVYASLLEDMAASDVDILRRCHRSTVGNSWHSSVSWSYHRSLRSTANSVASAVSSSQTTAQVRQLLDRLTGINLADLVDKDKQELCSALAQQQAVVDELKSALYGRSGCAGSKERFYHVRHRPTLRRRRKPQLRLSVEEAHDQDAKAVAETKGVLSRQRRASSGDGAVEQDGFTFAMRTESGVSEAYALQRNLPEQVAETDVSSHVMAALPVASVSPPGSPRRRL